MCYERRRAEACVDESAHHALVNLVLWKQKCKWLSAPPQLGGVARKSTVHCPKHVEVGGRTGRGGASAAGAAGVEAGARGDVQRVRSVCMLPGGRQ
jgi:hypothetical protein